MMGSVTAIDFPGTGASTAEVQRDDDRDENPEQHDELALRHQIGFAGLVDQLGDFEHGAMHGQSSSTAHRSPGRTAGRRRRRAIRSSEGHVRSGRKSSRNSRSSNPAASGWLRLRPHVPSARRRVWEAAAHIKAATTLLLTLHKIHRAFLDRARDFPNLPGTDVQADGMAGK